MNKVFMIICLACISIFADFKIFTEYKSVMQMNSKGELLSEPLPNTNDESIFEFTNDNTILTVKSTTNPLILKYNVSNIQVIEDGFICKIMDKYGNIFKLRVGSTSIILYFAEHENGDVDILAYKIKAKTII